ncbi:endopeptidase La [Candidatus Beckwithbacteria bacterium CG22_combo_CG10-13_8_21_14_all_01_47_9]|uniref:Lon protease n=2 Tax=Candidatus Beckwithiibacteriota TaxID=1752726 RepID=A0A2H0E3B6_9BACT|nr:MAG: endopeptidase La [Candidatus Beckwithbacteria bacterium CG22_combo_CG10-13_8_21_14_all_01_47_9]PJC66135.1 MAG: endopeptidase La [Candidatus Beckwithbacteria bacterium CG_4_9_14_0_2_um_filter_47_11]
MLHTVPLVPLREGVVFPHTEAVLTFGRPKSNAGVEAAFRVDRLIVFVTQKNSQANEPGIDDIYTIGTLCSIERILKTDGEINALVKGMSRVKINQMTAREPFLLAQVEELPETTEVSDEMTALTKLVSNSFKTAVNLGKSVDFLMFMRVMGGVSASELADQVSTNLDVETAKKQALLEEISVKKRLQAVSDHLAQELKILEIERTIYNKTQKKFDKSMRENVLRERMRTIQKELGEDDEDKDIKDYKEKIAKAGMSDEVKARAVKELDRLRQMHAYNPETGYLRTYLDWLCELPWSISTPNQVTIKAAESILEADHYGLQEVKERILEYLAVMQLKKKQKQENRGTGPTILCFVGPPGVGKTSLGRSIARALKRKFVKVSLGGIRDEAEIRGHRRTYIGALPGRIIQGIKTAGSNNPVFMLDEIDKVGNDFRGDPSAALLEALDPEQNREFSDHYLEVPFDLSQVMFITTANILDTIPPALRDRLEVIRFSGYTADEKEAIGKKYLITKALTNNGLDKAKVKLALTALKKIIDSYTREAGVRNLEREINKIMRKIAKKIASGKKGKFAVAPKQLDDYLGPARFLPVMKEKRDEVGLATGLAWTQSGGDVLFIEVSVVPGKGRITLTGQLGDVMKESAQAAISYVRSRWKPLGIDKDFYYKNDIHLHVPEGAVPKDGPSAGITMATALISALTNKKVKKTVAMTGEITLRGRVLEIGGVKEKVIAAHRAGITILILPKNNQKDLWEVPEPVKHEIKFHFVSHLDEVLRIAFLSR